MASRRYDTSDGSKQFGDIENTKEERTQCRQGGCLVPGSSVSLQEGPHNRDPTSNPRNYKLEIQCEYYSEK